MSTATNFNQDQREALAALQERFGSSLESFLSLRPDSYEQALAAHSLGQLEECYSTVLKPGITLEQAQMVCPAWPAGSRFAGRQPSIRALSEIGTRLRTESTLNDLGRVSKFLDKLRSRATALPVGQQTDVLDSLVTMVGQEMIEAKMAGVPVSANLDPLDRLLTRQSIKSKEREQSLKEQKFLRETCELFLTWVKDQRSREIAESGISNSEKIELLGRHHYGDLWDLKPA
jgi:hypothetical protein